MNTKIKQIRKSLGLSQTAFAQRIGLTQNYLSLVESGDRTPSDRTVMLLCKEFNVNPEWISTGEGEMFLQQSIDDKIAAFTGSALAEPDNSPKKRFLRLMANVPEEWWGTIGELLEELSKEESK